MSSRNELNELYSDLEFEEQRLKKAEGLLNASRTEAGKFILQSLKESLNDARTLYASIDCMKDPYKTAVTLSELQGCERQLSKIIGGIENAQEEYFIIDNNVKNIHNAVKLLEGEG